MKKESKELVRMLALGLAIMLALPLCYRLWTWCHPQEKGNSLTTLVEESNDARRRELLRTSPDRWTETDVKLAPDVHEWLKAHAAVILPWEWSPEAKKKDPDGYRALWLRLVEEELGKVRKILSRLPAEEAERLKSLEKDLDGDCRVLDGGNESARPVEVNLLAAIRVTHAHRELLKRQWPSWVPGRVRKWIGD